MRCISSIGEPISTVLRAAFAAIMGPIVEPHAESFFTMKSYIGIPPSSVESLAIYLTIDAPTLSVMYLLFALVLMTYPS